MKTKFTLFFFVFALYANIHAANAQVNVQDSLALVDLYNSTNGPNWYHHLNWLTKKPLSTWVGIRVTNARVTSLDLSYNNLTGTLPASLGYLVKLEQLGFAFNKLTGTIPTSIGHLTVLRYLYSTHNKLSGNIPSSIANLKSLTELDFSQNELSGNIPTSIGTLVNLNELVLSNNKLSGNIPASLGNLINLTQLLLSQNEITGNIPYSIGNLVHVYYLNLSNNRLSGSMPSSFKNLTGLWYFFLNDNELSGHIPNSLSNLKLLSELDLSNNKFDGSIPSSLANLPNLYNLELSGNHLNGDIPFSFGNLNLSHLGLGNNCLTGIIPSSLGNIEYLSYLNLSNNQLSGTVPAALRKLEYINRFGGFLDLSNNNFTFDGIELIAQTFPNAVYFAQRLIPVHQNGNALSVSVGGTLSNNTYTWFNLSEAADTSVIKGDSVFQPKQNGLYRVKVTNSIATELKLHSVLIRFHASDQPVIAYAESAMQLSDKTHTFSIYPNPARGLLHVATNGNETFSLLDQSGKILLSTNIIGKGVINISSIAAGLYYLKNNTNNTVQKVVIAR
jgi:Leucine-rich repeat (LRR) protein